MKIGIMTWFSYDNYGSLLQAFALCKHLEMNGHEVKLIHYLPKGKAYGYNLLHTYYLRLKLKIKNHEKRIVVVQNSEKEVEAFREKFFSYSTPVMDIGWEAIENAFDKIVCGSDQIWSPVYFEEEYYLSFIRDKKKKIAYAPSLGVGQIKNRRIRGQIKDLISDFAYLSVREETGRRLLQDMTTVPISVVSDPTLFFTKDEWKSNLNLTDRKEKEPYLLAYFLGDNDYWKDVYEIARQRNLQVKVIPMLDADLKRDGAIQESISPTEFLSLIFEADFVCTDSFHGVIFSLLSEKQFKVYQRHKARAWDEQNSRIDDLFRAIGLEKDADYMDYHQINQQIQNYVNDSRKFLFDALKEEK